MKVVNRKMLKKSLLNFLIFPVSLIPWLSMGMLGNSQADALPGQSTEEVGTWIKAHPTLQPRSGEKLFVQKTDTAAQRFTFKRRYCPLVEWNFLKTVAQSAVSVFPCMMPLTV